MDSMEEIHLKHGKMVYGFLLTRTQDPDLAEELTWLCGIAKNLWYEHARSRKNHVTLEEAGEIPVDSAETQLFHSWDSIQILRLIHNLENPMREVMYLRLVGNLTFGQIGEIMEKSENWARVTYYRAKERVVKEAEKL